MKIIDREFLPTSTPTCHASTVAFFNGKKVYAWFGGEKEGQPDSAIYIKFEDNDKLYTIGKDRRVARWNPILFPFGDKLFIFVKAGVFCDRWQTYLYDITGIQNHEDDITPPAMFIPAGLNGPVKTKVIVDPDTGLIYCGSSVETASDWTSYIEVYSMEDNILQYEFRTAPLVVPKKVFSTSPWSQRLTSGIIQPSLWIDKNRVIHAFFRSARGLDKVYHSCADLCDKDSLHQLSFTQPEAIKYLDNPNSGVDTVYYENRLFLVYNPSKTLRNPLMVAELDEDFAMKDEIEICDKASDECYTHELSYPYMIERDGILTLTYTYGRSKIEHCTISID